MTWIQTYTGRVFDLLNPEPESICIEDIAHALSRICRYTGHTPDHYSVAQHCVLASEQIEQAFAFEALMHDAAEAYVGDVSAPLKRAMRGLGEGDPYREIERRADAVIAKRFSLTRPLPAPVKVADMRMLATEKLMLGKEAKPWELAFQPYEGLAIEPWPAEGAKNAFLDRFEELSR